MPYQFHHRELANGLTIISETDPSAHSSAVGFFVRTGARDEDPAVMGVSHYLEHMMFKGTESIDAEALNRAFDDLGARNNAYTTTEMTCFYASVLPEHLPKATELVATMMRPALRDADFDTEKNVILEEIKMYQDNPFWVLYESAMAAHYGAHGLGHRVLGTSDSVSDLTSKQMRDYFESRYAADNTVVSLAGRVDFDEACAQIESLCGSWARTGATRAHTPHAAESRTLDLKDEKVGRGYMLWLAEGPGVADPRRYAATLLMQVLGASENSRLHWSLIETGLAEEAQAGYEAHDGVGDLYIYASGDPDRLGKIADAVRTELASLVDSLTEDDLARLRSRYATGFTVGGERPGDRMQRIGRRWTTLGEHRSLEEELERISAVTIEDLRAVADAFPFEPRTEATLTPA